MKKLRFAVLGAGAGGQTMAAFLTEKGYPVRLYDHNLTRIQQLQTLKTIRATGKWTCQGTPEQITDSLPQALDGADIILVVTTTDAHSAIARQCAPYLRDGQIILLNPGHVGGALEVRHILLEELACSARVIIAETGDLMFACRMVQEGEIFQSGIKQHVAVAALPASDTPRLMEVLGPIFPSLHPVGSILETGFEGGGAMLHPIPSLMNLNRMDRAQDYDYYIDGITPSIARLVSACDCERLAVCRALGLEVSSLVVSLQKTYGLEQTELYDLLQHNAAYRGLKSPMNLEHRFIIEDLLCGIVPLASIGAELGVETPIMNAFIEIGSVVCGRDFRAQGRTAEKLGLSRKTPEQIQALIR